MTGGGSAAQQLSAADGVAAAPASPRLSWRRSAVEGGALQAEVAHLAGQDEGPLGAGRVGRAGTQGRRRLAVRTAASTWGGRRPGEGLRDQSTVRPWRRLRRRPGERSSGSAARRSPVRRRAGRRRGGGCGGGLDRRSESSPDGRQGESRRRAGRRRRCRRERARRPARSGAGPRWSAPGRRPVRPAALASSWAAARRRHRARAQGARPAGRRRAANPSRRPARHQRGAGPARRQGGSGRLAPARWRPATVVLARAGQRRRRTGGWSRACGSGWPRPATTTSRLWSASWASAAATSSSSRRRRLDQHRRRGLGGERGGEHRHLAQHRLVDRGEQGVAPVEADAATGGGRRGGGRRRAAELVGERRLEAVDAQGGQPGRGQLDGQGLPSRASQIAASAAVVGAGRVHRPPPRPGRGTAPRRRPRVVVSVHAAAAASAPPSEAPHREGPLEGHRGGPGWWPARSPGGRRPAAARRTRRRRRPRARSCRAPPGPRRRPGGRGPCPRRPPDCSPGPSARPPRRRSWPGR